MDYTDDEIANAPRDRTPEQEALFQERIDAYTGSAFATPEQEAADAAYHESIKKSNILRSAGIFVTDIATRANESITALGNKFGQSIPFTKAGARTPTFSESSAVPPATVITTGYQTSGLISTAQLDQMYNATVPITSAAAYNQQVKSQSAEQDRSHLISLSDGKILIEFVVMPEVVENRNVSYEAVQPPQFPGAFQKYKGTESVQWTVNVTLVARTTAEATQNLRDLNTLRAWTMPFFGERTRESYPKKLGAPPPVLKFKGLRKGIIGEVPVVITSLNWNWPRDVDYIPAQELNGDGSANIPFPTVMTVAIQLVESFSTKEFNNFSLADYYNGDMIAAYNKTHSTVTVASQDTENQRTAQTTLRRGTRQEAQTVSQSSATAVQSTAVRLNTIVGKPLEKLDELKTAPAIPPKPIVSGQGGDFGGGGSSGRF